MKAYEVAAQSGQSNALRLVARPDVKLSPHDVRVRMHAVSLNYRDLGALTYSSLMPDGKPLIPTSDGAGVVEEVGAAVTRFRVGDRVVASFFQGWIEGALTPTRWNTALGWPQQGLLADRVVLNEAGLLRIPDGFSFQEAATLPCAAVTAWHALITKGQLAAGQKVLILGTGGVSIFALQLAKAHGAVAIITSSSNAKLEKARALGADVAINYKDEPEWHKRVLEATAAEGVDNVIEVGGAGTLPQSMQTVKMGGRISLIGVVAGLGGSFDPSPIIMRSIDVQGIYVGSRVMFEALNTAAPLIRLRPVIDRVFSFSQAPDAFRYLKSASHFGKVVIDVSE